MFCCSYVKLPQVHQEQLCFATYFFLSSSSSCLKPKNGSCNQISEAQYISFFTGWDEASLLICAVGWELDWGLVF